MTISPNLVHDGAIALGCVIWSAMAFVYPEMMQHLDGMLYPTGLVAIAGGAAIAKGTQNAIQGGATAPNEIVKPQEKKDDTVNQ